jgi:GntR family galactonate operon transcriptional repressor
MRPRELRSLHRAAVHFPYDAMDSAGGQVEAFIQIDLAFHSAILEASGNRFLLPVAHGIRSTLLASLRATNPLVSENRRVSLPLHAAILAASLASNGTKLDAAMRAHLEDTERRRDRAARQRRRMGKLLANPGRATS